MNPQSLFGWPLKRLPTPCFLVDEYEFALRLLGQAEGRMPRVA
jgi:hypothetical protein